MKQIIYHGSYTEVQPPKVLIGKYTKDFGAGFYCTALKHQAVRWAQRYDSAVVSSYSFELHSGLKVLEFSTMTDEWLDFIAACRHGEPHDYDIVIGAMADDQIYNYVADFISGVISREQFWVMAKFSHPTHQICFCTEQALCCLTFIESEIC